MIEQPRHGDQPKLPADEEARTAGSYNIFRRWHPLKLIILAAVVLIAILVVISGLIQKGLWMQQLGYSGVFWTLLSLRWELFCAAFVVALLYLWVNLRLTARNGATSRAGHLTSESAVAAKLDIQISPTVFKLATAAIAAVAALIFALIFYAHWDSYLRFRYGGFFGLSDPLFGVDAGIYLFRLPFYKLLQGSLTALALITLLAVLAFYAYFGLARSSRSGQTEGRSAKAVPHLSTLFLVLIASLGWGFYLDHYELLYFAQGMVYGAGYTADHVTRIAFWIMVGAAAALCALLVLNIFRPRFRAIGIGSGIYVALYFIAVLLVPALFQKFAVQPNELARETPYLKNNIEFNRRAYSLDTIQDTSYPALLQNRQNIGSEKIADVLEEIWHTADRELPMASLGSCSGLLRNFRAALVRIKDDAFGACLCCGTVIGLRRLRAVPWTPLCLRCQEAADRNDAEVLRIRSRGWHQCRRISRGNATKSILKERNVNRV